MPRHTTKRKPVPRVASRDRRLEKLFAERKALRAKWDANSRAIAELSDAVAGHHRAGFRRIWGFGAAARRPRSGV